MSGKFLKIAITLTVVALVICVGVFVATEYWTEISTAFTGFVDEHIFGYEPDKGVQPKNQVEVRVSAINSCAEYGIEQQQEDCIFDYFRLYYSSLGGLERENMAQVFSNLSESSLFTETELDFLIEKRKKSAADLSFANCNIKITYEKAVEVDAQTVEITLSHSAGVYFACSEIESGEAGIEHIFVMQKTSDGWIISSHTEQSDVSEAITTTFEEIIAADGYIRSDLTYYYIQEYTVETVERMLEKTTFDADIQSTETEEIPDAEYAYNATAAVEYALNRSDGRRNTSNYGTYKPNSMNFVSQCIAAGGIPMDSQGNAQTQWKWYGNEYNNRWEKVGTTHSWSEETAFMTYCLNNSGFGLVSILRKNVLSAQAGDAVLFGNEGEYSFSALVVGSVYDKSGNVADLLVCTKDIDRRNYPVSALVFGKYEVIGIVGYNTANF